VSHIAEILDVSAWPGDSDPIVTLRMKPKHWIREPFSRTDEWHGIVAAKGSDVARLLWPKRQQDKGEV
jgi:hypothetical protein